MVSVGKGTSTLSTQARRIRKRCHWRIVGKQEIRKSNSRTAASCQTDECNLPPILLDSKFSTV